MRMSHSHLLDAALAERLELTVHRVNPLPYRLHLLPRRIRHAFQLLYKRNYRCLDSEIPDTYQSILNLIKQHGGSQLQHLASATICTKNTKKMLGWNRFYEIYLKFVLRQHQDVRTEEAVFVVKVKLNSECLNRTV